MTSTYNDGSCAHCGGFHLGTCPRVKRINYRESGAIASIEFHDPTPSAPSVNVTNPMLNRDVIARLMREEFGKLFGRGGPAGP